LVAASVLLIMLLREKEDNSAAEHWAVCVCMCASELSDYAIAGYIIYI
jgi:hypothetical protein